jgi:hypothetical protein
VSGAVINISIFFPCESACRSKVRSVLPCVTPAGAWTLGRAQLQRSATARHYKHSCVPGDMCSLWCAECPNHLDEHSQQHYRLGLYVQLIKVGVQGSNDVWQALLHAHETVTSS